MTLGIMWGSRSYEEFMQCPFHQLSTAQRRETVPDIPIQTVDINMHHWYRERIAPEGTVLNDVHQEIGSTPFLCHPYQLLYPKVAQHYSDRSITRGAS